MTNMTWLTACYSHPLCGCVWMQKPFTVKIDGDAQWPKLSCTVCGCPLHTSDLVAHLGGMIGDTA